MAGHPTRPIRGLWRPIVNGPSGRRVARAVGAVAAALRRTGEPVGPLDEAELDRALRAASLAQGRTGRALFSAYHAASTSSSSRSSREAARLLEEALAARLLLTVSVSLYGGFPGVAWAATHLRDRLRRPRAAGDEMGIEAILGRHLGRSPWSGHYDLISGLVGLGVYAIERLPRPAAVECLSLVVARLEESAELRPEGLAWPTAPELLPPWQRELCPRGYYNLGVAHGVPGVIALLAEVCAAGVARAVARPLLDGAVAWLLAQKLPTGAASCFPHWVGPGIEPVPSRLAWCYGDAGIAATLLLAARRVGEPTWEREALAIARRAAERPPDRAGVVDAGLCHGAAGVGHLFNRLYQASGDPTLREAARFWFERALGMRRRRQGIAGFVAYRGDDEGWVADPGLLEGAAGVGLALLAATTSVEPAWDRALLVAIPPRGS